jgi:hypothetical protein
MSNLKFLLHGTDTAPTGIAIGSSGSPVEPGTPSATVDLDLWYSKGVAGGQANGVRIRLRIWDGAEWLIEGSPALTQAWFEVRLFGGGNPGGDPSFVPETTNWTKIGTNLMFRVPAIPGNAYRRVQARVLLPQLPGVASESATWELVPEYEAFVETPNLPAIFGQGILKGVGDRTVNEWIAAQTVTPSGAPDAFVHVGTSGAADYMAFGNEIARAGIDDIELNQNDGASVALGSGEEYTALIVQSLGDGSAPEVAYAVKGLKAATGASVAPALPADTLLTAVVVVLYNVSGSAIASGNITVYAVDGRMKPSAGAGLTLIVGPGRSLAGSMMARYTEQSTIVLPDSVTRWVWVTNAAEFVLTDSAVPPPSGASPICSVTTDGVGVTALTDLRHLIDFSAALSVQTTPAFQWIHGVFDFASFYDTGSSKTLDFTVIPGHHVLHAVVLKTTAAFVGGSISEYTVKFGKAGALDRYLADTSVHGTAPIFVTAQVLFFESEGDTLTQITATATSDTLDHATDGSLDIWMLISNLP